MSVRDRIVAHRRARIAAEGHCLGVEVPQTRSAPLVPFLRDPGLICEIKRRSPSRGAIDSTLDPVALAGEYARRGVRSVSVLTEEDHFAGSLADLIAVKRAYPDLSVLRKDFLIDDEDIDVSFRAGADAVLLIASILTQDELARLHARAVALGMTALVELHDDRDFERARAVAPPVVGINARDLSTFRVDLLTPLRLRGRIDWPHRAVFESGAFHDEDAMLARSGGFEGLLVGEAAVRNPDAIDGLTRGLGFPVGARSFWTRIASLAGLRRPIVKICGITNAEDAEAAVGCGADLLGFVFADSPRRATPALLADVAHVDALKVAVVVAGGAHGELDPEVRDLLDAGLIDAVQFHGDETLEECARWGFPYYNAVRVATSADVTRAGDYRCPRVLVDARVDGVYGGSGARVPVDVLRGAADAPGSDEAAYVAGRPLWIAGGLTDTNVADVIRAFAPELIDASSGLEREPGRKDHDRMRAFFDAVRAAGRGDDGEQGV